MLYSQLDSAFLKYLLENNIQPGDRLSTLNEISEELGISTGKLREQLEIARSMGLVSVRPRLGIQREPFDFAKILLDGMLFGLASNEATFEQYSQLRQTVEAGFWQEAVVRLTETDKLELKELVAGAWYKLRGEPIHIPNNEHRAFHLKIFSRLENPFVQGILEAYWAAYAASELTRFASYDYWVQVWNYHERIVETLCVNNFDLGQQLLVEHFSLLRPLPTAAS